MAEHLGVVVVECDTASGPGGRAARQLAADVYDRVGFLGAGPGGYERGAAGLLTDPWMAGAVLFTARLDDRVVGASRLITPLDGRLPALAAAASEFEVTPPMLEVSMLVSDGTLAGASTVALIRAMWQHAVRQGTQSFVALLERPLLVYLTRFLRTDWQVIGPPHHDATGTTLPVRFDVGRPGRRISPQLWGYLTDGLAPGEVPDGDGVPSLRRPPS